MMKASKSDRQIARAIVMAQLASDAGKRGGMWDKWESQETPVSCKGAAVLRYGLKPTEIIRALRMIDSSTETVWRYYVEQVPDQNGYPSVLVYFETKDVDGKRLQISFHSPLGKAGKLTRWIGKGRKTRWVKQLGKSRIDAKRVVEIFNLDIPG